MQLLSNRQDNEMRLAILEYLQDSGLTSSFNALIEESGLESSFASYKANAVTSSLLEKKWLSVVGLQKRILELEERLGRDANHRKSSVKCQERTTLVGHRDQVTQVHFHPTDTLVASCSDDCSIRLWDYSHSSLEFSLKSHTQAVHSIAFHPSGSLLASCSSDSTVKIWNLDVDGVPCIHTWHGHDHSVSSVCWSPDGSLLASASRDKSVRIWETVSGFCIRTLFGHDDWVRCVVWSMDGQWLASSSNDQSVIVWAKSDWSQAIQLRGHSHVIETLAFVPKQSHSAVRRLQSAHGALNVADSEFLLSGSRDKTIKLWNVSSGQCLHSFTGHDNWVRSIAFPESMSNLFISVSDDKRIVCWDLATGHVVYKVDNAHSHFITSCHVNKDGSLLATGSVDKKIIIWSL